MYLLMTTGVGGIEDPGVIQRILAHLECQEAPGVVREEHSGRGPPQLDFYA